MEDMIGPTCVGVSFFLPSWGSRGRTQTIRLGSKHLYPLSSPTHPPRFAMRHSRVVKFKNVRQGEEKASAPPPTFKLLHFWAEGTWSQSPWLTPEQPVLTLSVRQCQDSRRQVRSQARFKTALLILSMRQSWSSEGCWFLYYLIGNFCVSVWCWVLYPSSPLVI